MNPADGDLRPPQIAYIINQYPQISHTFIRNEIRALEQSGFDVLRIALRGWDAEIVDAVDAAERDLTNYLLQRGVKSVLLAFAKGLLARPGRTLKALNVARRMSQKSDRNFLYHFIYVAEACLAFDLTMKQNVRHVHAHFGSNACEVAMLLNLMGGPPFSFTVHGPEEFDKPLQLKLADKIKRSSFVVGVSSFGKSQLYRYASAYDWPKIKVVHCGLGDDYIKAGITPISTVNRLICVGRLCEQKGQMILLHACRILADRGVEFEIVLVGDGEMRQQLELEVIRNKLTQHVKFAGWLGSDAIRSLLNNSKGLVLPSFAEGLPVAIMEAMCVARPVITTYVAGIPELVRDGVDGYLVPAGSAEELAGAMERLFTQDMEKLKAMGEHARTRAISRHSSIAEAKRLGALILESIN